MIIQKLIKNNLKQRKLIIQNHTNKIIRVILHPLSNTHNNLRILTQIKHIDSFLLPPILLLLFEVKFTYFENIIALILLQIISTITILFNSRILIFEFKFKLIFLYHFRYFK